MNCNTKFDNTNCYKHKKGDNLHCPLFVFNCVRIQLKFKIIFYSRFNVFTSSTNNFTLFGSKLL